MLAYILCFFVFLYVIRYRELISSLIYFLTSINIKYEIINTASTYEHLNVHKYT
jgi:hypothetical protein